MRTGWIHTGEQNNDERFAPKTIISQVLMSENGADLLSAMNQLLLDRIYPVGAVYLSVASASPETFLGGTWERIGNKALVALGDTPAPGDYLTCGTTGELECQFVYVWKRIS